MVDQLPADAWLTDLGTHPLRDLPRPERVVQLCHPDLRNDFPPLRTSKSRCRPASSGAAHEFRWAPSGNRPDCGRLLAGNRLVTSDRCRRCRQDPAGGTGRRRVGGDFADGVWYVDLAPITDPDVVPVDGGPRAGAARPARPLDDGHAAAVCRRPSAADRAGQLRAPARRLRRADRARCSARCPALTLLATSREPIGVAGEVSWRVPSLSLADEAIELFTDRARLARPDFAVTDDNAADGDRDLPAPRRHAAGDRAGGRAGAGVVVDRDPRQPA